MTHLTARLEELKKLCESATDGWGLVYHEIYHQGPCTPDGCPGHDADKAFNVDGPMLSSYGDDYETKEDWDQCHNDAKFIASSRGAMPKLIKALEVAIQQRDKAIDCLNDGRNEISQILINSENKEIESILCEQGESEGKNETKG